MSSAAKHADELAGLAAHLMTRRESVLRAWRREVDRDPRLTTASSISRAQFDDHIPEVLDAFERQLGAHTPAEDEQARVDEKVSAAHHGLHRWQQGYDQSETMREWGHLHLCLLDEIERYGVEHSHLHPDVLCIARRMLVLLCNGGVCESTARYLRMQRTEAAGRVRDLEEAFDALKALERQRAETWREAAHDLRTGVSVIANATTLLDRPDVPDPARAHMSQMLRRNATSLHELLTDLMSLARLEAGHEQRNLTNFDAATLLKEYCESLRPLAAQRGLFLHTDGPESLPVQGDSAKIQRIVQNLVMNALKVTERGGVRVLWEEGGVPGREQWIVCIQDTGPGLHLEAATPLKRALRQATADAHEVETRAENTGGGSVDTASAPTLTSQTPSHAAHAPTGEGIGLSIVKRMCELLDASVELESSAGKGTTFRVTLPRRYDSAVG